MLRPAVKRILQGALLILTVLTTGIGAIATLATGAWLVFRFVLLEMPVVRANLTKTVLEARALDERLTGTTRADAHIDARVVPGMTRTTGVIIDVKITNHGDWALAINPALHVTRRGPPSVRAVPYQMIGLHEGKWVIGSAPTITVTPGEMIVSYYFETDEQGTYLREAAAEGTPVFGAVQHIYVGKPGTSR